MGVGIELRSCELGFFDTVGVVVAIDLVAFVVYQRRVAVEDGPANTGEVDSLGGG